MDNSGKNNINGNLFSSQSKFTAANPFHNDFSASAQIGNSANPFETPSKPVEPVTSSNPIKRLKGYDSTILNNTKFEEAKSEEVSIEYRIKDKESTIKDLKSKIKIADNYGTQNEALSLKAKRQRLLRELDTLRKQQMYGNRVLGEQRQTSNSIKETMPVIYKVQDFISRQIMARISKKVNSVVTLSDSLDKLAQISKNVDELIDMNVPYGEKVQNYEKLTEYLNQANLIHSKITKSMRK